jgi:membrane-associated HD superfamily phosphohydrolase
MNYFIFIAVYFMSWIMLGVSLIILGSFFYYIIFKNKSDIHYYLRSLFNLYGKYLIFNLIISLVMLSVRLNMELIIGYSIIYIGIFFLLNLFSYLIMEFNFFKFQSSNYLKNEQTKKIYFILIADQSLKIFFIVMMIMNNIEY